VDQAGRAPIQPGGFQPALGSLLEIQGLQKAHGQAAANFSGHTNEQQSAGRPVFAGFWRFASI
jgi:hypothetical protein